jgi:hypothetical protein
MANLAIALLLLALTLAITCLCREPFEVKAAGDITCKHIPRVGAPDTCSVEIVENETTKELDAKCRPLAVALGAEGMYQRTKYSIVNNGRFAKRDQKFEEGTENVCSFILSDDLVQGTNGPLCETGNPNLYDSDQHSGLIQRIDQNGPFCEIEFKSDDKDELKNYVEFLTNKSTKLALNT